MVFSMFLRSAFVSSSLSFFAFSDAETGDRSGSGESALEFCFHRGHLASCFQFLPFDIQEL